VFALGAVLAGLAGALQMPKEPASLDMDLNIIGSVFVVVVVGGMGSVVGAFLASLLVCEIKALCIGFGVVHALGLEISLSKFTLVAEFIVMAVVLVLRPWGLMGKPLSTPRALTKDFGSLQWTQTSLDAVLICCCAVLALLPLTSRFNPYWMVLANDIMIAALFALSLFLIMGPAGMPSFGHAAFLGLGGYATALLVIHAGWPTLWVLCVAPLLSVLAAMLMGWFVVRLSGVYMAMLTLAFAQIVWAGVFQWDALTAGSNGLLGVWPSGVLAQRDVFYGLTWLVLVFGFAGVRWMLKSPFGLALLASRDSPLRAQAIGLDVRRDRWLVLLASAWVAGWAGALLAFSKGSISPDSMQVTRSVDGLVMVLLGGMQASLGALLGAVAYVSLQDHLLRSTEYWRAALGAGMLVLVLLMPHGLMGFGRQCFEKCQAMRRKWA
jgi:branched-chain amino acid transport system permease protein